MSRNLALLAGSVSMNLFLVAAVQAQTLLPGPSYQVGSEPYSIALGDFDGNGCIDLVTANKGSSDVSTLLGLGAGAFAASVTQPVSFAPFPGGPQCVATADFSEDGVDDIVVSTPSEPNNPGPGGYRVLLSQGDGHYQLVPLFYNSAVGSVTTFDINADGHQDFIHVPGQISLGTGNGGFTTASGPLVSSQHPREVAPGDIDLDGQLDLVMADWGNSNVYVFTKFGPSGFAVATNLHAGGPYWIHGVAVRDIDHDGRLDVVTANLESNTLSILRGIAGLPYLQLQNVVGSGGYVPRKVAIADLNHDGYDDLISANSFPGPGPSVGVIAGNGTLNFSLAPPLTIAPAGKATSLAVEDFNQDGSTDLAATLPDSNAVQTFFGDWMVVGSPQGTIPYGVGTPGCTGAHVIQANEPPTVGSTTFAIRCTKAPAGAVGVWMFADARDPVGTDLFGVGVALHVDLLAATFVLGINATANAVGDGLAAVPVPNNPNLVGGTVYAQALWSWPLSTCFNFPFGLSTSNGLAITIQP